MQNFLFLFLKLLTVNVVWRERLLLFVAYMIQLGPESQKTTVKSKLGGKLESIRI